MLEAIGIYIGRLLVYWDLNMAVSLTFQSGTYYSVYLVKIEYFTEFRCQKQMDIFHCGVFCYKVHRIQS